jgi:CheY-like chemotaxis protein/signal transduction histidine kinase
MLCLACLNSFSTAALTALTKSSIIALNTAFANLLSNDRTRRLSEKLRESNQELTAQQEELKAQAQELQKQSEALQAQNIELAEQRLAVEEASRLKSQFLSNMSHELRTPLNSVMALSRVLMMQAKTKLSDEEISYLEIIERNGKNLLNLINNILDLSKIEAGKMDIQPRPFSLGQTLDNILESIAPLAEEKHIQILKKSPKTLPLLESDEIRVSQILQNLVANAVKFTTSGSVSVTVKTDQEKIHIQVTDTGIGIAEQDLPHIFDEFRQVDGSSSRRHEGTGLGLTIAHKAARMLGGDIFVTSTLGMGTTFILTLPLTWQGQKTLCQTIVAQPSKPMKPNPKTILVVDDEPKMAKRIAGYLLEEGYHPVIATSGEQALTLARSEAPFAIVLDIIMPDMDGWEVLQSLKKNSKTQNIPVIIVSVSQDRETGFALGAIGYLTKEDRERLHNNVASVLDKSRVTPETLLLEINRTLKDLENPLKSNFPGNSASAPRILMVEDNEVAIIQIKSVLTSSGYVVDVTTGGQEAIDYVSHTIPDGIVLDLMMPEIDGFEVLEKIRNKPATARIPVLILTAKDLTPEDFKRLSANNIQQLVHKGDVDREGLLLKIGSMIEGKQDATNLTKERFVSHRLSENPPPETILIMEDNPDNMATIKAILQNRYRLIQAMDGEKGLQMATENTPDLILLDMALPKMDGMTVVKHLKDNQKLCHIPVIALTARVMKGDREKILKAGCNDYISKPIDPTGFIEKITEWLKG